MKLTPEKLGTFVRTTRKGLSLTQRSLALASGTGLRFIIELEKGKATCQLGKVLAVINALGISVTLLLPEAPRADRIVTRENEANRATQEDGVGLTDDDLVRL